MEETTVFNELTEVAEESVTEAMPTENGADAQGVAKPTEDDITTPVEDAVDYEQIIADDLRELKSSFPELASLPDLSALPNAMRYAALRDLGLTATEAYLATAGRGRRRDNRSHLVTAVSRSAGAPRGAMTRAELAIAKELFSDMSEAQIYDLYRKVKK